VSTPNVGDPAPSIVLEDQTGTPVDVAAAHAGRRVLVFFYPKANTPGCTTQACGLRDIADQVGDTAIIGISPDTPAQQASFDTKFSLGFTLLADVDHAVAEAFGVWVEKSMYGRKYMGVQRSGFLIDAAGNISHAWPKITPKDTPVQLLRALGDA
jgi:peroxiredoxin Q/BCP